MTLLRKIDCESIKELTARISNGKYAKRKIILL